MSRLTILTYHSIDPSGSVLSVHPETFAAQMAALDEMGIHGVSLREAIDRRAELGRWPDRTVALTFDDGYRNLHDCAAPALARHGFTATAYVITDHVGGRNDWEIPPALLGAQAILGWSQLRELADAGWEIGAHTRTHPDLRRVSSEEVLREITGSRDAIEQKLGRPVATFAYPYGYTSDAVVQAAAREFRAACTTVLARAGAETPHTLPRVDAYYLRTPRQLAPLVAGRLDPYLAIRRWGRRLRHGLG